MDVVTIHREAMKHNDSLDDVQPVFVTVDPERDTPEKLEYYLQDYPFFIGLTGSPNQIKKACASYKVHYSMGPKSDDGDYILDHTIVIYLINPLGKYQNHFMDRDQTPEHVHKVILESMALYNKFHKS